MGGQLIREGDDGDDGDDRNMHMQPDELEPSGFEGRGGALVEEAKAMLQQEDDDTQAAPAEENAGKKIKMGKLGKKNKKGADSKTTAAKSGASAAKGADIMAGYNPKNDKTPSGGFSE